MLKEQEILCRMNCRRFCVMKFLLRKESQSQKKNERFWVDGKMFRRFISCEDTLDDKLLQKEKPILTHKEFICSHGLGVHPMDAHKGKYLDEEIFEAYLSILKAEKLIIDQCANPQINCLSPLCDIVITGKNLRCVSCEKDYKRDIREKTEKMVRLIQLYTDLDPTNEVMNVEDDKEEMFAISRSFISSFRRFFMKLSKEITGLGTKTVNNQQVDGAGLGALEMNKMLPWLFQGQDIGNEFIDPTVNGKITCKLI